jgi:hypothetical protein
MVATMAVWRKQTLNGHAPGSVAGMAAKLRTSLDPPAHGEELVGAGNPQRLAVESA